MKIPIKSMSACLLVVACSLAYSKDANAPQAPALGNLKGVPVSIPAEYQFFAVNYVGENVWAGIKNKEPATLDTPIESFGIRVRLPDLVPVSSLELLAEWKKITNTSPFYPWINPSVRSLIYDKPPGEWGKAWIGRVIDHGISSANKGNGWHYERAKEKKMGLVVMNLIGPDPSKYVYENKTLMYDEETWNTVVFCPAGPRPVPGGKATCEHRFHIHEMNASVTFNFYPEHLEGWRTNQEKITALLRVFVVDESDKK